MVKSPLAVPFLTEARNWSERRQLESYVKLYRVQNEMLGLLANQQALTDDLRKARQESLARLDSLESIREIETLRIRNQLEDLRTEADLRGLRVQLAKEELQVKLAEVRLRRLALESPSKEPPPQQSAAERVASSLGRIREMDEAFRQQRDKFVEAAGGEANLSEGDRDELDRLEILRRTQIEKLYEEMV